MKLFGWEAEPGGRQTGRLQPGRVMMLSILAMFILPLALAWMMYSGAIHFHPTKTRNLGHLVTPVVPIEWTSISTGDPSLLTSALEGYWVVIYPVGLPCLDQCREQVIKLRQVHRAAGRDQTRIKMVLLFESPAPQGLPNELQGIYPAFFLAFNPTEAFIRALRTAADGDRLAEEKPDLYLVDPLGNIMMTYNGDDGPDKLSKDLDMLLTWSKLDKSS